MRNHKQFLFLRKTIEHFATPATHETLRGLRSAGERVAMNVPDDSVLFDEQAVAAIAKLSPTIGELIEKISDQILYVRIITPPPAVFCLTQSQYGDVLAAVRELFADAAADKHKDIPQGTPKNDMWEAFQNQDVEAVFRYEFGHRYCLHEFMENHGLRQTRDMLALVIESRKKLRAAWEAPEGGVE